MTSEMTLLAVVTAFCEKAKATERDGVFWDILDAMPEQVEECEITTKKGLEETIELLYQPYLDAVISEHPGYDGDFFCPPYDSKEVEDAEDDLMLFEFRFFEGLEKECADAHIRLD